MGLLQLEQCTVGSVMIRAIAGALAASCCLLLGSAHAQAPDTNNNEITTPRTDLGDGLPTTRRFVGAPETADERNNFLRRRGEALEKRKIETVTPLPEQRIDAVPNTARLAPSPAEPLK